MLVPLCFEFEENFISETLPRGVLISPRSDVSMAISQYSENEISMASPGDEAAGSGPRRIQVLEVITSDHKLKHEVRTFFLYE